MKKYIILYFILCASFSFSQNLRRIERPDKVQVGNDTLVSTKPIETSKLEDKNIRDYLKISQKGDTTYIDTTLTIKKYYKFNYLRKDNFNLIAFSNIGQTYNTLSYDFSQVKLKPNFGARARHFNYQEIEEIDYYHVPTPLTELFYKSAFEQGQVLDALFTVNLTKQLNLFIGYKGLRSLGKYQSALTSTGNFKFGANYTTKNERYNVKAHVVTQDLLNNENGGLTDDDIENFRSGDEEFSDRSVFEPNLDNAENILVGKRFYLNHYYNLNRVNDSIKKNSFKIGNVISFEDKNYRYTQDLSDVDFFGPSFASNIRDEVTLEDFFTSGYIEYDTNLIGTFKAHLDYNNINYGYDNILSLEGEFITNRIKDDFMSLGGAYSNQYGKLKLNAKASVNLSDAFKGFNVNVLSQYIIGDEGFVEAQLNISDSRPNYNFLLYQSDYINYNWDNSNKFENEYRKSLAIGFKSNRLFNLNIDYTSISNYTYFGRDSQNQTKPFQSSDALDYIRLKLNKEFNFGNFALDNTIMYQNNLSDSDIFNIPDFIVRNTFYYQNQLFDKALFLQTGVSFNYFTEYNMNSYDPLLAEFVVQNETSLGAFPRLDFFVNAKIRQTRIFIIAEHFNSSFTGYNYFSAPNYPYRDFAIRFGLVWNFFL